MVSGDNVEVTLTGGAPWGFRLTGGASLPLEIAKIRKKSQAHAQGLREGDAVVSINGTPVHDLSHDQAVELIEAAGDTLKLHIYRGDADDLGQVLASNKAPATLAPLGLSGNVTSSTSSTATYDDGTTRGKVQQESFVTQDGDVERHTFVRRETSSTVTTEGDVSTFSNVGDVISTSTVGDVISTSTVGDVNGNDVVQLEVSTGGDTSGSTSRTSSLQISSTVDISSSSSTTGLDNTQRAQHIRQQQVQQQQQQLEVKPVSPIPVPRGPTFKAVPPKTAPQVAPKPSRGPPVAPKPAFSSTLPAPSSAPMFTPTKFQVSATAMYTPGSQQSRSSAPQAFSTTPQPFSPGKQQQLNAPGKQQQPYSPGKQQQPYSPGKQQQPYSPGKQQQLNAPGKQQQPYSPGKQQQPYSPGKQQQPYSPGKQPFSAAVAQPHQLFSPGSQQPFSPGNLSSPVSPGTSLSQPFSPMSPGNSLSQPFSPMSPGNAPMFNVRNNMGEGATVWTPNMWLPGQEPSAKQQQQQQQQQQQPRRQQQHQSEDVEVPPRMSIKERQQLLLQQTATTNHSLSARQADPDFDAPPEEEQQRASAQRLRVFAPPVEITPWGPEYHLEMHRTDSVESGESSPTSSIIRHRKKMYADSAFYEDPQHKYPTIDEQMKLCRLISQSLTSAANKKARGARMFAKRKKRSSKWVHEAHFDWSSSAGDVANLHELDSELSPTEGGNRPLFTFRIPNVKLRVASPERNTKMSMKKDEFERLRLQATKCDHRAISPGTCFDIVADLKASKGRGGRLFERRKNRADKFIVDESNARKMGPKGTKLEDLLNTPLKSNKTPWEAAQTDQQGKVDAAFDHLTDMERMQKLNQMLKYTPPKPAPPKQPPVGILEPLTRPYEGPRADLKGHTLARLEGRNFNRYAKGWQAPDASQERASMSASWASSDFDAYQNQLNGYGDSGVYSPHDQYLPACDL
nr:hypothetical protein BaRGS_005063 [Batillaria attramentaria]